MAHIQHQEITIGNTHFHIYDQEYVPSEDVPIGTIGVVLSGNYLIGLWISSGGNWQQFLIDDAYGAMRTADDLTTLYDETITVDTWNNTNDLTWEEGLVDSMELQGAELHVTNDLIGRFLIEANSTWYGADAAEDWLIEETIAKNNTVGQGYQGGTPKRLGFTNIQTFRFEELNALSNDYINHGYRYTQSATGNGFNPRRFKINAKLVDRPIVMLRATLEDDSADTAKFVFVNDTTNQWYHGAATSFKGTKSIYISNDGGVSNTYTNTVSNISHVYVDLDIPEVPADWIINYHWKTVAESGYDFLQVYVVPITVTPVAGTELNSSYLISGELNDSTDWVEGIYTDENLSGQYRLVFSWINDGSVGTDPPAAIDSISVYGYIDFEKNFDWTSIFYEDWASGDFTTNSWVVANNATNAWIVGSAESAVGTNSAFISDDGANAEYTIRRKQVSHIYKDIAIPSGATAARLAFQWKCTGENGTAYTSYDFGNVFIEPTSVTPVAGTQLDIADRVGATANLGKFNLTSIWSTEDIDISAYIGTTIRLVFSWVNDRSVGVNPPFVVDDIKVDYR
jgi:hypothetical protein